MGINFIFDSYIKNNKEAFKAKVESLSSMLMIDPNWLMSVMLLESSLNPQAINKITGAVGLIQFMPATAKELGVTLDQLYDMDNIQQLDYVYKYLSRYKGKMNNLSDVYLSVFFPAKNMETTDTQMERRKLKWNCFGIM